MYRSIRANASALVLAASAVFTSATSAQAIQVDCTAVPDWDSVSAYASGARVVESQQRYTANWWNQNTLPSTHHGEWGEWTLDGTCLPAFHAVDIDKELLIRDLSVVDSQAAISGELSWLHLIEQMMPQENPTNAEKEAFVLHWLNSYLNQQVINEDVVATRPQMQTLFIEPWRGMSFNLSQGTSDALNFDIHLFRLLAIVYRPDLHTRDASGQVTSGGEARFVFSFNQPSSGGTLPAKVIFEYGLEANSEEELLAWAEGFHALGALEFGEQYNQQLIALTNRFTGKNTVPHKPNGNALNQLRTNELPFADPWQLREFKLSAETGLLEPATVAQTPADDVNGTQLFADYVNSAEAEILDGSYVVPLQFAGEPLLGGASDAEIGRFARPVTTWNGPGILNNEARHIVGLNTCSGCHGTETNTEFSHVVEREVGEVAEISAFMSGVVINLATGEEEPFVVEDPVSGELRQFHELDDRKTIMDCLLERCFASAPEAATVAVRTLRTAVPQESTVAVKSAEAIAFEALMAERRARAH
ncbi:hypothetical protein M0G74_03620 [Microbulbifer sp. CAU 1566]|uniref:hypothetical protein n=1 Tax=Microbulbifer sp. CAU 1566 TaxID=2933269 RepID=UPI00200625C5|nr:hypothetical protein [Microbulbifer sp. CAU 1566]MCK7596357.1 hypothetical protein [Microbulbifer sp. CAU 1566]